jgi:hypothetical protein
MSVLAGDFLRLLNGFLSLLGQFVKPEWHNLFFLPATFGNSLPEQISFETRGPAGQRFPHACPARNSLHFFSAPPAATDFFSSPP